MFSAYCNVLKGESKMEIVLDVLRISADNDPHWQTQVRWILVQVNTSGSAGMVIVSLRKDRQYRYYSWESGKEKQVLQQIWFYETLCCRLLLCVAVTKGSSCWDKEIMCVTVWGSNTALVLFSSSDSHSWSSCSAFLFFLFLVNFRPSCGLSPCSHAAGWGMVHIQVHTACVLSYHPHTHYKFCTMK